MKRVLRWLLVGVLILFAVGWWRQWYAERGAGLPFDPAQYDGQALTLTGTLTGLDARISNRGNRYYTFVLDTGSGEVVVFQFGAPPCPEGSGVTVEGVFHHVEQRGGYTFYNQLDATRVACQ